MNCGERSACAASQLRPRQGVDRRRRIRGKRGRTADQQRHRNHDSGDDARQDQHGRAPVVSRHQAGDHRRHRHRRHAHAGRDQRHCEAAVSIEPAGDGRHHRREDRRRRAAHHQAEQELKFDQGGGAACQRQRGRDHGRSRQHHRQRPELVRQRAPDHAGEGHGEEADGHGGGDARHRPAGVARDRLQQHRQREHAADRDTAEQAARGDDHPAIVGTAHFKSPFLLSQAEDERGKRKTTSSSEKVYLFVCESHTALILRSPPQAGVSKDGHERIRPHGSRRASRSSP